MHKVFLGVGHGGSDSGAVGYLVEKDVNLNIALACRDYLIANGIQVKMSRTADEDDKVMEEVRECNEYNPELAVDIHSNSGGGDGFEAYYHFAGGLSKTLAENIEKETVKIGQNSRGIKTKINAQGKDYYAFIRETICPAIIAEGVFVDNKVDSEIADTVAEQKIFGVAYAKGIMNTLGVKNSLNTSQMANDKEDLSSVKFDANGGESNTANDAIDLLASKNIIDSPEFWKDAVKHQKNLDKLFIKFAKYIK